MLPQRLIDQGVTEQDIIKSNSNTYDSGFMQIHLIKHFRGSFTEMDNVKEKGPFLHEYIYYLQNLTAPWGLYFSMGAYNIMIENYEFIQKHSEIKLPLRIDLNPETKRISDIIMNGNGDNPFYTVPGSLRIDRTRDIVWHRTSKSINGHRYLCLNLNVPCEDAVNSVRFGANIIKESMAALYQMQLDPTATHEKYNLPYNLVKIIAEPHFPNIATDDKKLITICYISLFSLSPAVVLIEQLDYANKHVEKTGPELLDIFINETSIKINGDDPVSIIDFYDEISIRFERILQNSLQVDLDYIHETLQRIELSNGVVPIISTLYDKNFSEDLIQELIDYIGIPYIYTDFEEYHYPQSTTSEDAYADMVALVCQHALYYFLVHPNKYRCCPLRYMCKESSYKDECFDYSWLGERCPMTVMGDNINLNSKNII